MYSNQCTMKLLTIILFLLQFGVVQAQVVFETSNPNLGFGTSSECSKNTSLDFVVNGPLVNTNGLPVGGYIDGVQKKPWVRPEDGGGNFAVDNAIFGLGQDGKLYMFSYTERHLLPPMKWAFQNGPVLVRDGLNVRGTSATKFVRSGVGYTPTGNLVVIISEQPVTFREFAQYFVQAGCVNAIYLDGGPYVGWSDSSRTLGMVETATKLQFYNN